MLTDQLARARVSDQLERAERAAVYRQVRASNHRKYRGRDFSLRRRPKRQRLSANPAIEA